MHFVCSPSHPLAIANNVSLQDLGHYDALLSKPGTFTRELLSQRFDQAKVDLPVATSTNNLDTLRMLASTGMGWSLLPHTLLNNEITAIESAIPTIVRHLGCVSHKQRSLSNPAQQLMILLQTL